MKKTTCHKLVSAVTIRPRTNRHMKLSQLLTPSHILPELRSVDRWQALDELLDHLVAVGEFSPEWKEEVKESLHARESMISTGVGGGVAIPHAFSEHIDEVVAVFGRSHQGIDFASQDANVVHFVVLFISPRKSYQKHLHALAAIARMFTKPETRDSMLQARNAEELYQLFRQKNVILKGE
jgi:mannitol/fructose-specific phosphotransferase system IIA component (Ntr-type)